jgi:hypothetical protein
MADYKTAVNTHGFYSTEAKTACQALVDSINACAVEAGMSADYMSMQQFGY